MTHSEAFQLGEQFPGPFRIQMLNARAAIGGDDAKLRRIGFEQSWHEAAAAGLEMAEYAHFVGKPLVGFGAVENFDHPAIEGQVHGRAQRIFDF